MPDLISFDDLAALVPETPETLDVPVPQWGGKAVRLQKLGAEGLVDIYDFWVELPKGDDGKASVDAASLVKFYETLLIRTAINAEGLPLFNGGAGLAALRSYPAVLMFLGEEAQRFNGDLLLVSKEKKSELPLEISLSPSAENSESSTPTTSTAS